MNKSKSEWKTTGREMELDFLCLKEFPEKAVYLRTYCGLRKNHFFGKTLYNTDFHWQENATFIDESAVTKEFERQGIKKEVIDQIFGHTKTHAISSTSKTVVVR